jgi:UDP-N-acetyl-D-mannosaminuronic acid dehydrogenase
VKFGRVSVIGLGYIGLPTAAVLASRGVEVVGVDVNPQIVDIINRGQIHIAEPELDIIVQSAVNTGRLRAVLQPEPADAFVVAVPTPFRDGHQPDLSYIEAAAASFAPMLKRGDLVVLESTSPVGATEKLCEWLAAARPDLRFPERGGPAGDIFVAHCPERVLPGRILRELVNNDRLIGGITAQCTEAARSLYSLFVQGALISTDVRTAEMAKLAENAFRDVNIAFANELSLICDRVGINVWELIELANHHPRVNILQPGAGVGGHCIAVDPWFLVAMAPDEARLIRTARQVNDHKPAVIVARVNERIAAKGIRSVAILGLAFKPDVDDLRESPAVAIARGIAAGNPSVRVDIVEPYVDALPQELASLPNASLVEVETALSRADLVVGLVRHRLIAEALERLGAPPIDFLDFVNFVSYRR